MAVDLAGMTVDLAGMSAMFSGMSGRAADNWWRASCAPTLRNRRADCCAALRLAMPSVLGFAEKIAARFPERLNHRQSQQNGVLLQHLRTKNPQSFLFSWKTRS
jgi:hypothetical protein